MYFNVEQMSKFYKSVIRPSLEYGSVIFDNCSKLNSIQLEHVQRRAANVCSGAMKLTESVKVLAHLGWESLQVRRERAKLQLFFKIKNGLVSANYLHQLIPPLQTPSVYNTRQKPQLITQLTTRLKSRDKSFFPSSVALWNRLPVCLTNNQSFSSFKNNL